MDNDREFKSSVSLFVFVCEHGKHCNFISDCNLCAKAKIVEQKERITELEKEIDELKTPDYFGTTDEHFAESLDELSKQFDNCYEVGSIQTINHTKDLGDKDYIFGIDVAGKPTLTPVDEGK